VAHEPLNETAHRELMSSWARLGETARAVRHYEELTELLREQVGVPPAPETTALYRRLLTTSLAAAARPVRPPVFPPVTCPVPPVLACHTHGHGPIQTQQRR